MRGDTVCVCVFCCAVRVDERLLIWRSGRSERRTVAPSSADEGCCCAQSFAVTRSQRGGAAQKSKLYKLYFLVNTAKARPNLVWLETCTFRLESILRPVVAIAAALHLHRVQNQGSNQKEKRTTPAAAHCTAALTAVDSLTRRRVGLVCACVFVLDSDAVHHICSSACMFPFSGGSLLRCLLSGLMSLIASSP